MAYKETAMTNKMMDKAKEYEDFLIRFNTGEGANEDTMWRGRHMLSESIETLKKTVGDIAALRLAMELIVNKHLLATTSTKASTMSIQELISANNMVIENLIKGMSSDLATQQRIATGVALEPVSPPASNGTTSQKRVAQQQLQQAVPTATSQPPQKPVVTQPQQPTKPVVVNTPPAPQIKNS